MASGCSGRRPQSNYVPEGDSSCPPLNVAKSAGKFSSSNIRICRNSFVSRVEHSYGEFTLYRWKLVQKLINALTAFKVIEKRPDWNAGTDKHQTTAEDIRVSVRDICKRNHARSPFSSGPDVTVNFERPESDGHTRTQNAR
jgi:hypothetical protein